MMKRPFSHEPCAENASLPAKTRTWRGHVSVHNHGVEPKGKHAAFGDFQTIAKVVNQCQM
jgi:hypothetical protein